PACALPAYAQALRISLTQPARNHPRKTTTAATKQISATKIVQSATAVTPRNAETHRNRPPSKARTAAIKGARMISPGIDTGQALPD
ncbi:MAG: hypothetical protein WBL48_16030, partial [Pseudolabrys sp.]